MIGYALLTRFLAAIFWALLWLLAACWWIVLPISHSVRYPGLAVIAVAIWVQHGTKKAPPS